jgi:hemolysin III
MKPRLRGVSHEIAFYVSIVAVALLVLGAPSARASVASVIYGATLATLFGVSALYHRPTWAPGPRQIMRRLDHAAIFLLIAGTYTPMFWLVDGPASGHRALWTVWIGAAVGVVKSILWPNAPKAITAAVCLLVGWGAIGDVVRLRSAVDAPTLWLLVIGGVLYSAGALVYARRRPDPAPLVFGYHEIFHALVVVAGACHFVHVARIVRGAG